MTTILHVLEGIAAAAVGFFVLRWDARRRPYAACLACRGRRGKNIGSTDRVWGRCPACGGKGERRRLLAVIFGGGR